MAAPTLMATSKKRPSGPVPVVEAAAPYAVDFFTEDGSNGPVWRWITEDLTDAEQRSVLAAFEELVAEMGNGIVATEFGKAVGDGVIELRLRQSADEIRSRVNNPPPEPEHPEDAGISILLRVFLHPHGQKRVLVLHGYSKGKNDSGRHQQKQIAEAKARLGRWRVAQARQAKEGRKRRER